MKTTQHAPGREEFVDKDHSDSRNQRYIKPSRNLTWIRDQSANGRDHTTRLPVSVDPPASSISSDPAVAHPYRFGTHKSPQYAPGHVYFQNVHGAHGAPSYGHGTHIYRSHSFGANYPRGSRDRYPPSYGNGHRYPPSHSSSDYYPTSNVSRDRYPPSYGYRGRYPPLHSSRDYYPPSYGSRDDCPPFRGSKAHYPQQGVGASDRPSYGVRTPGHLSDSRDVLAGDVASHGLGVNGFPSYKTEVIVPSPKFPVTLMCGLPKDCRELDIIQFLRGIDVVDVFLIFTNKIFSRKAFVVFSNAVAAGSAIQRDKRMLGDMPVQISSCRRQDYYDAVAAAMNAGGDFGYPREKQDNDCIVETELHGHHDAQPEHLLDKDQSKPICHILKACSPCFVDKNVMLDIFGDCNLCDDRVHNVFHPDGKLTGEMLLEFISQEDAEKAMSKNKTMIESHLIEIIPYPEDLQITNTERRQESDSLDRVNYSTNEDLKEPDTHSHGKQKNYNDKQQKVYAQVLKLANVPPSADMYDIIEFFGEFNLTLDRLQVVCLRDGMATGEVYVEFDSVEDAKKAISKDEKLILTQCVELFPSSPEEASRSMSRS